MRKLFVATFLAMCFGSVSSVSIAHAAGAHQDVHRWGVMAGASLRSTLDGWSASAGWTLIWDTPVDYRLRASARFTGTFEDAVRALADGVQRENPDFNLKLYRGNSVIHVAPLMTGSQ